MVSAAIDETKIRNAACTEIPFTIQTYTLPHEIEESIEFALGIYLEELGQGELKNRLAYCLRELAVNAKKANTKRIYFEEKELDIHEPQQYEIGMRTFKKDTLQNIKYYLTRQEKAGLYVKVSFQSMGGCLTISVRNNVKITQKEHMRIYDRIARSRAYDSMEEALTVFLDDSEGAGLGIVILIMALKDFGLDEDAFNVDYDSVNGETLAQLVIPFSEIHRKRISALCEEIAAHVDRLPLFPESVIILQDLIDDPESEILDIADKISMDPSLTAGLLKLVNSPHFMFPQKIHSVVEAVKLLGLKGLKKQLYSYGAQKVLVSQTQAFWEHSYKTAFYAFTLAKNFKNTREFREDVYVGGMLHDMGKVIFSELHPTLLKSIDRFCKDKGIPRDVVEDFSAGFNHAEIGGMIATKWNFPPVLVDAIRYHHEVNKAPAETRGVVEAVALANSLVNLEEGRITPSQLDKDILAKFGVTDETQLHDFGRRLKTAFNKRDDHKTQ